MLTQCAHSESLNFTFHITAKIKWKCLYMLPIVSPSSQNKTHIGDALFVTNLGLSYLAGKRRENESKLNLNFKTTINCV